jgi:hypothetical protein
LPVGGFAKSNIPLNQAEVDLTLCPLLNANMVTGCELMIMSSGKSKKNAQTERALKDRRNNVYVRRLLLQKKQKKLRGLSSRANYTD